MTAIRVGIVGAGAMGRRHAAAVRAHGDTVAAVHDPDPENTAELIAENPGAVSVAAHELASMADAAVIATPSPQHLAQAIELLDAGLDVLVEKPHRIPGQDPEPLLESLRRSGRMCMVGMTTRHRPGFAAVAQAVRDGVIGSILGYDDAVHFPLGRDSLPAWYFDPARSGGGVLLTNGVHVLDRARAALQSELTLDGARLVRVFPEHGTEDAAEVTLHAAGGIPVHVSLLWSPTGSPEPGLRITGTRGAAVVRQDGSWELVTEYGITTGDAVPESVPLGIQWGAFRDRVTGFAVADLEPTLCLIEEIYRRHPIEP